MDLVLLAAAAPVPEAPTTSPDGGATSALVVVGVMAFVFVGYLTYDWCMTRREARKLAMKKQRARKAWQDELANSRPE